MKKTIVAGLAVAVTIGGGYQVIQASEKVQNLEVIAANSVNTTNSAIQAAPSAKELFDSMTDIQGHWAASAIYQGIQSGYVAGYSDRTFKPNGQVTRAEFIKMVTTAMDIKVSSGTGKWYLPYVNAAVQNKLIDSKEYVSGDYNTQMTRVEMARLSVRAIGQSASSDDEYMLLATKAGLISGLSNGDLAPQQTTTRAQAVVVIQRVLTVLGGGTNKVDEAAVAKAEKELNSPKDPWGRKIRTTNLPKNYKDFPYILEGIPNEMYEMKDRVVLKTPIELFKNTDFSKENMDKWAQMAEQFGNQILNVNYQTIDAKWVENLISVMNSDDYLKKDVMKYVNEVKRNKVKIQGSVTAEPTIVYGGISGSHMRVKFNFKVINYQDVNDTIFYDIWLKKSILSLNGTYEGYADIPFSGNAFGSTVSMGKVTKNTSFFQFSSIRKVK